PRPCNHVTLLCHGDFLPMLSPSAALRAQPLPEYTGMSGGTETKTNRRRMACWHCPQSGMVNVWNIRQYTSGAPEQNW
ncbi:MAG TPA: hypothetical protein VLQ80_18625, partial [Candidatus Saccharimonadia bacterium]|nr:hypothetical protein [Candidatus Saccharimonadia bacterium]